MALIHISSVLCVTIYCLLDLQGVLSVETDKGIAFLITLIHHFKLFYLGNIDSGPKEFQVLPHLLWFEFGIEDGQLSEHAHVSTLKSQSCLQHSYQLLKIATVLKVRLHTPINTPATRPIKGALMCH